MTQHRVFCHNRGHEWWNSVERRVSVKCDLINKLPVHTSYSVFLVHWQSDCKWGKHFYFTTIQQQKEAVNSIARNVRVIKSLDIKYPQATSRGAGPYFSDSQGLPFGGSVEGHSGVQIQVRAKREPKFMFYLSSNSTRIQFGLVLLNRCPPSVLGLPKMTQLTPVKMGSLLYYQCREFPILTIYVHQSHNKNGLAEIWVTLSSSSLLSTNNKVAHQIHSSFLYSKSEFKCRI